MKIRKLIFAPSILLMAILACTRPEGDGSSRLQQTLDRGGSTPVANVDAVDAIQTYAQDTLGLDVSGLRAGGRSGAINLPVTTREGVDVAIELAGTTYFGLWKEGFASLSIGDSVVSGDVIADVEDGSLGAFWVRVDQALPMDVETALAVVLATYPKLNGYEFEEVQSEELDHQGYTFNARQADDIHIQAWEVTLTGTTITAGVAPGIQEGKSIVWAVVASGVLAGPIE